MEAILAIDQSTSGTKALLFNLQGGLIDQVSCEHRQYYPHPGWVEHDAEEIYQNCLIVVRALLDRSPEYKKEILGISLTNQRETVVIFDKDTGSPLFRAIVWQCRRGAPICEDLVRDGYDELVQKKTGLKIDTYFSASKIRWLIENEPQIGQKLRSGQALVGTIDSYLIYRFTRGKVHATDFTNASRTLLFNIGQLHWDEDLCQLFQVPLQALPEVRESSANYGETSLEGILDQPLAIRGVMGDSQASLFAQHCFELGSAKVTFGTGSSVLLNIGDTLRLSENGIVSTIAWVYKSKTTYAFEGIINYSAATIAWLKNQLKLIENAAESEELALAVEDNGGVFFVPAFVGLGAPYWEANARAAIVGLTPHSTRNHVVRAALESIAYQIKDVLDIMVQNSGIPLLYINGDGGAARNRFLMQFVADMVGYPLRVSKVAELSALGAVFAGYLGMSRVKSFEELNEIPHDFVQYKPTMPLEKVNELYAGWKDAVRRVI